MYLIRKDIIVRNVNVEGIITNVSPLRIGAGRDYINLGSSANVTLLRDSNLNPYIPGSSWKGVFRSTGERIAKERGIKVCTGLTDETCMDERKKEFNNLIKRHEIDEAKELVWESTCLNCKLFGAPSLSSALLFFDSLPSRYNIGVRTMIAINRKTGTVVSNALAIVEYVEPGAEFHFRVLGSNLPNYAIGYLVKIMRYLHEDLSQIGGYKSRGFGFIRFKELELKVVHRSNVSGSGTKLKALDEYDADSEYVEGKFDGDTFFKNMRNLEEVFDGAKLEYPM
jgi:CRISPR-associated RAMP protein (TIGR02581 family)